jgi:hypothetical protein
MPLSLRAHESYAHHTVALVHGGPGDRDHALAWLEMAYVERSDYMPYLGREPMLDGLRSDPRFAWWRRVSSRPAVASRTS